MSWVPSKPRSTLTLTLTLALTSACSPKPADRDDLCADIGSIRACWTGAAARIVPRAVPKDTAPSAMGWRCIGAGTRASLRRARRDLGCVRLQRSEVRAATPAHARRRRMALLGQRWRDGVCGREPAAGSRPRVGGASEPASLARRAPSREVWNPQGSSRKTAGSAASAAARRRPSASASTSRRISRTATWTAGDAGRCTTVRCAACASAMPRDGRSPPRATRARPCVDGSRCVDSRCIPDRPAPACVLQTDCGSGRCRFGSCLAEGT